MKVISLSTVYNTDGLLVDQALERIERTYVTKYIQNLLNSESMRLFEFLK